MGLERLFLVVLVLFCLLFPQNSNATHLLGGDITWVCDGAGNHIFQLRVFRDCSGPSIGTAGQSLRVWNHPTINQIPLSFVTSSDLSPTCTPVAGGPAQILCSAGSSSAVEEYIFKSAPIQLNATPPAAGFAFTWDAFSRPNSDNLLNAANFGLTLRSIMYAYNGNNSSPCADNSPQFTASPNYIVCAGKPFVYAQDAYDPDIDSLVFSFGNPLDQISTGTFNPPGSPLSVPFQAGYSFSNPMPDASFNAGNVPASLDPVNGNISFTSFTQGKFNVVTKVQSYRQGQLISEVYREVLLAVLACGPNEAPIVTPPFAAGTSWSATFIAGSTISFNLSSNDPELLQDGSPQSNTVTATGLQFGTGYTNAASGCPNTPCATLNTSLPQTGVQGISTQFNWGTTCDHLPAGSGSANYTFTFRFSDDYCSVPGITSATVNITLLAPPAVSAPQMHCADVALNGDVTLTWTSPSDPYNIFSEYQVYNNGTLIGTIPTLGTTSFTHIGADAHLGPQSYHIKVISGCDGTLSSISDTITSMYLQVNNPGNGTAQLVWNPLITPPSASSAGYYQIYQEYPIGTWNLIDSVPLGTTVYVDTISVCDDTLNYRITIGDAVGCLSHSSIDGDRFTDLLAPYIPITTVVTVDTATGLTQIIWNVNPSGDTQGYIILFESSPGNWILLDTILGINNTTFINLTSNPGGQIENYGVVAFDSCYSGNPAVPNMSAMSNPHRTIYLEHIYNICEQSIALNWNTYNAWPAGVSSYDLYASENGAAFTLIYSGNGTSFLMQNINRNSNYCFVVIANQNNSTLRSFSNKRCVSTPAPGGPSWSYLSTATVENGVIEVHCLGDLTAPAHYYRIERSDDASGPFINLGMVPVVSNPVVFYDFNADPNVASYYYRAIASDSCGADLLTSNLGRTIFLTVTPNHVALLNTLQWNHYEDWDGNIVEYRIYRSVNGVFDPTPVGIVPATQRYFEDHVEDLLYATGEFCYYIEAVEDVNSYGISALSHSNIACATIQPLVWVPNAFMVNGNNPVFLPVISYVDYTNYTFRIFDRWGELIFHTDQIGNGWDGNHKGDLAREGVYVWTLEFDDGSGQHYEKRGFVTLLIKGKE